MENSRFKFRVWDKQDECYAYSNNSDVDLLYIETDGNLTYGVYSNDYKDMSYIPESEVIIEQCTGLKDRNGKLIYENDYVKIDRKIYKIFWNKTKISLVSCSFPITSILFIPYESIISLFIILTRDIFVLFQKILYIFLSILT